MSVSHEIPGLFAVIASVVCSAFIFVLALNSKVVTMTGPMCQILLSA